jgi:small GTP-binding protein
MIFISRAFSIGIVQIMKPTLSGRRIWQPRVVIIGEANVGKTSLLNQFIEHRFNDREMSTVGANFQVYSEEIDGVEIGLQIWDTAGQEKFRSLSPIYFRKSRGALVVFDVTNEKSFAALEGWISMFTDVAGPDTKLVIVGNKCDLPHQSISMTHAREWAQKKGLPFFETSAKTGKGLGDPFRFLAKDLAAPQHPSPSYEMATNTKSCSC